jgi:hypothetical protein
MKPEELYKNLKDRIVFSCLAKIVDENTLNDKENVELIQQAKSEWCKFPTEKEIDKKRKEKMDIYSNDSWNRYSDGFMDAICWMRNYLNTPEP